MSDPFAPCPACHQWCRSWARGAGAPCGPVWDRGAKDANDTPALNQALADVGINDPLARGLAKMGIAIIFRASGKGIPAPLEKGGREDMRKGVQSLKAGLNEIFAKRRR